MPKSQDAFRTISEVADWLETPAHVLRFWESRFTQVKPVKRAGGRRYYRPADMELLSGIKKLLHEDGLTIKGVQKLLRAEGIKHVAAMGQTLDNLGIEVSDAPEMTPGEIIEAAQGAAEILTETDTNQVISFPTPADNPEADEPVHQELEPVEVTTESAPEPPQEVAPPQDSPRQASFLDAIPEANLFTPNVETPSEPISETADEPEIAPTEADEQIAAQTVPSEITEEIEEYDIHKEHSGEPTEDDLMNLAALDGLSEIPSVELEDTSLETTVDIPAEEPAQQSQPADFVDEPASDEPVVSETTVAPPEIEAEDEVVSELENEPTEEAIPEPIQDIESVPDSTLEPKSTAQDPVEIDEEAVTGENESSLEPEVEALEESEDDSRVNTTIRGAPETVSETPTEVAPVIEEAEATPSEETPTQVVTPIQAETPADPSDDTPDFSGPTARERLTRRATPFSPDKKSELAELSTRLAALRETYGIVSKPTSKN